MAKIKYAVIGLGRFGETHCETLAGLANVELYALCTRRPQRLHEMAQRFGVQHIYTDYHDLLANPEVDAVDVVTMWDQHAGPTLAALQAGKHVFVEKPLASTVADCDAIVTAARTSQGFFMVGHVCRFNPRYAAAKAAIQEGCLGRIISLYARRNIPAAVSREVLNKIGPIVGDGVHDTDLMLWYTGAKVVSAFAQTVDIRGLKYPDLGWTMYRFDSGAVGVLENIWCLPDGTPFRIDERMEIVGTEGTIHIQETYPNYSIYTRQGWSFPDTTYWPILHGARAGALREELAYFTACIQEGRRPTIITPEEARAAVAACLAAEKAAATGEIIYL